MDNNNNNNSRTALPNTANIMRMFFLWTRLINAYTESKKYIKLHTNVDHLIAIAKK